MFEQVGWISLKACIITLQKNKCVMCKKYLEDSEFTLHHIVPRAKGGKDTLDNLIGLCDKCHDIAELKELNREEIVNYYKKYSLNDYNKYLIPIKKSYFMPEIDNQVEYKYPKEIILKEKYIIKPKKVIIGFQTTEEFKERIIKACKNYKYEEMSWPLTLSGFCRMATEILMRKVEEDIIGVPTCPKVKSGE